MIDIQKWMKFESQVRDPYLKNIEIRMQYSGQNYKPRLSGFPLSNNEFRVRLINSIINVGQNLTRFCFKLFTDWY